MTRRRYAGRQAEGNGGHGVDWWTLGPKPVWMKRLDLPIDFRHVEADRFRDETGRDGDKIIKPQFQVTHTRLPPYAALMDVYNAIT